MFRAGRLPSGAGSSLADPAACASALGAICAGAARPAEIAAALGRPDAAVADLLAALAGLGLIERLQDPLNAERSVCVIVKPIVRLHSLVIAPNEAELAGGRADLVWARSQAVVADRIYRPHFASVARQWCLRHAGDGTLGGVAGGARLTGIGCREHRQEHELEAVIVEDPVAAGRIAAIGETNAADEPMDAAQLRRLEHLRGLLPSARVTRRPSSCCSAGRGSRPASPKKRPPGPTSSSSASSASTEGRINFPMNDSCNIIAATIIAPMTNQEGPAAGKPDRLFDRDAEWRELTEFAASPTPGGRWDCCTGDGARARPCCSSCWRWSSAGSSSRQPSRARPKTSRIWAPRTPPTGDCGSLSTFADYREALDELFRIGEDRPAPVIIDEFPYLVAATPALPSYVQRALEPSRARARAH